MTKGAAPAMNLTYNGLTNRVNTTHGFQYDANGNVTVMPNLTNTFDASNRLTQVAHTSNGTEQYAYAPDNKRVWSTKPPVGNDVFYYHDVTGQRLGTYSLNWQNKVRLGSMNLFFGSKMIVSEGKSVVVDRLGSVRLRETVCCLPMDRMSYFPYGEERTTTYFAGDKFGTYKRDGHSGLDYADQRYYASLHGRFLTPDPYRASAVTAEPLSWNRYAYVAGDPVNAYDPRGLQLCVIEERPGREPLLGPCPFEEPILEVPSTGIDQQGPSRRERREQEQWEKAVEKLSDANDLLQRLLPAAGTPCERTFAAIQGAFGKSLSDIKLQANISDWNDATTSAHLEVDLYTPGTSEHNFWANSAKPGTTIAGYFRTHSNVQAQASLAISGRPGNIYFRPSYVNASRTTRVAALMTHEVLHNLGFDDTQLQRALGLTVGAASGNITQKVYDDCFR